MNTEVEFIFMWMFSQIEFILIYILNLYFFMYLHC